MKLNKPTCTYICATTRERKAGVCQSELALLGSAMIERRIKTDNSTGNKVSEGTRSYLTPLKEDHHLKR